MITANPVHLANWLIAAMFMIDVTFATVGYVLTMKPLDAHIRTANPYAAGWAAALICYPPFILMSEGGPLDYHIGAGVWNDWLADYPLATVVDGRVARPAHRHLRLGDGGLRLPLLEPHPSRHHHQRAL